MTCPEDVGVDEEQKGSPSVDVAAACTFARCLRLGRSRSGAAMEQTGCSLHQPLRARTWWKAVEGLGRGWGRANERGRGGGSPSAEGHTEGTLLPFQQAGAQLQGRPQLPPSWLMEAGSGDWVSPPSRLSPKAPRVQTLASGAVPSVEWRSPVGASRGQVSQPHEVWF